VNADKWKEIKQLQRAGRTSPALGNSAHLDKQRLQLGMHARVADLGRSRKAARRAREKARNE
jgi:hypothetical protein